MIAPADFRQHFPEFVSTELFPDSQVEFWAALAEELLSPERWGKLLPYGQELFIAHNLMLGVGAIQTAAAGGIPSAEGTLAVSSKSVGSVSVSYDTGSAMDAGAGHWNQTVYGRRYIDLVRRQIGRAHV